MENYVDYIMVEDGDFSEEQKENKSALVEKQQEFEIEEKRRFERKDETDTAENKKSKIISWAIVIATCVLVLILGMILL